MTGPQTTGVESTGAETDTAGSDSGASTTTGGGDDESSSSDSSGGPSCPPPAVPCDDADGDPWHALGLGCDDEIDAVFAGESEQIYVHEGELGTAGEYPPLEGEKFVILSTGVAADILLDGAEEPSTDVGGGVLAELPEPIIADDVNGVQSCVDNDGLIGSGDCSNTLESAVDLATSVEDYAELRITLTAPEDAAGFAFHHALFSTDYPQYYLDEYADTHVVWLQSEGWTGNIAYDAIGGAPMSNQTPFLIYKDGPNPIDCPDCSAPELAGTALEGNAATPWLTTVAPIEPGETFELVWAVFDASDPTFDTMVALDGFHWLCEDPGEPSTFIAAKR